MLVIQKRVIRSLHTVENNITVHRSLQEGGNLSEGDMGVSYVGFFLFFENFFLPFLFRGTEQCTVLEALRKWSRRA